MIAPLGMAAIIALAVLLSTNRRAIRIRVIGAAFLLQIAIAGFVLLVPAGQSMIQQMSAGVQNVMDYSQAGIDLIFGRLSSRQSGLIFAFHVLPVIVFFSSLMAVLYHLKIMQLVVRLIGGFLHMVIGTGKVESLNAAANIFIGQTEAPLAVKPYLKWLTGPQLFTVMVSGLASVAGTVLLAYASLGVDLKYLLAASFMAAPSGLLMAKLIMPDEPDTPEENVDGQAGPALPRYENVFMAAALGASDGVKLAVNIGAMLLCFVALIALVNGIIGGVLGMMGLPDLTLQTMLGWLFAPLMFLLSVPWSEASIAGSLLGEKLILNEFVAYISLTQQLDQLGPQSEAVITFALCGFANLSSIAILMGGLGTMVPERMAEIARYGLRAVAAGSLSNLMNAAIVGFFLSLGIT